MRLLLCCENYPPSVGGVQEVMRQVAERLAARGHAVTVATGQHPRRPQSARLAGVQVESFAVSGDLVRGLVGEVERYREAVLSGRHDAVLIKAAQQWTFDALVPVLDRIPGRKVFIPCGFSALHEPRFRAYYAGMAKWLGAFDDLVFYSATYRDIEFARRAGLRSLHVLPNGVDEREFRDADAGGLRAELGLEPDGPLLLSVGARIPAKGHWEVLRAFDRAALPAPSTLVINGNDPAPAGTGMLRKLAARARARRVPLSWCARAVNRRHRGRKRVLVVDLPRADLVRAFRAADLFVFASQVEYSPLVLFEAAAAGTPFLTSPVGNAREIAEWTSGGVVYEAGTDSRGRVRVDPRHLAQRLEACFAAPDALRRRGAAARERVLTGGYTWDAIVPRYEAILRGDAAAARSVGP